jgi:O-antigen/teichoic acid export membrane protein
MTTATKTATDAGGDGLLRHGLIVMILSQAAGAANMLFHVVMGRTLSTAEYGVLVAMLSTVLTVWMPMLAVQNTFAHFTEYLRQEGRVGDVRLLINSWCRRLLIVALFTIAAAFFGRRALASFFHIQDHAVLMIAVVCLLPALVLPVFVGILQGGQRFVWMSVAAQGWGVVRLLLGAGLMLVVAPVAVVGLIAHCVGVASGLAVGVVGTSIFLGGAPRKSGMLPACDRYFALSLIGLLAFSLLMYGDVGLVKHFFPNPEDYGNYARASTIARTIVFLALPITIAMFPKVVSRAGGTSSQRRTMIKALAICGGIIMMAVSLCWVLAGVMLKILFDVDVPDPNLIYLIRFLAVAMSPLGLTFALMSFEMAQNRFLCILPVALCAVAYVGGVFVFHGSLVQVISVLAAASLGSLVLLVAITFFRQD